MCAKDREELLRPGLSGGGGGRPLDLGATEAAGAADANTGAVATGFCAGFKAPVLTAVAAFTATLALALPAAFSSDFGVLLVASLTGIFVLIAGFSIFLGVAAGLAPALTAGFLTAVGTGLPATLATAFFAALGGLGLVRAAFFAASFLVTTAAFVFVFIFALTGEIAAFALAADLATGLAAGLATGLTAAFELGLASVLDALAGFLVALAAAPAAAFTAGLAAVLDFLICAFTACLLWEAAPW